MSLEKCCTELVQEMTRRHLTFGTAESLTAGLIAASVADVPGASAVLMGGIVSYDPRVKHELLGVSQEIIDGVGVISEPCARQMAEGARAALKVDIAVSATGLAGPGGGTAETPVGTVFIGGTNGTKTLALECHFDGSRSEIRRQSAEAALQMALQLMESATHEIGHS